MGDLDETETDNTIGALNKLNNNENLASDLDSCQKESRQFGVIAIIEIRFYVFWCGWFQVFVVEIRITIITATFLPEQIAPSPTTAAPTTAAPTTAAPGPTASGYGEVSTAAPGSR